MCSFCHIYSWIQAVPVLLLHVINIPQNIAVFNPWMSKWFHTAQIGMKKGTTMNTWCHYFCTSCKLLFVIHKFSNYLLFIIYLHQQLHIYIKILNYITKELDLNLRKILVKCYIWSMALYGSETWTLRAADQKYLKSCEMWCWRRMEKISWTDHVKMKKCYLESMSRGKSYMK